MRRNQIKLVSWNVNGIRAVIKKDFFKSMKNLDPHILAIQETKIQERQLEDHMKNPDGYESYWSYSTVKKGYSGVGTFSKIKPLEVNHGIGKPKFDNEGRINELVFKDFIFFNIYFPNGQMSEERLKYKLDFYEEFFKYANQYKDAGKPVIITGDFNTAHNEIDLKNPKPNEKNSGFLRIERDWLDRIIDDGWVDTFRHFNPDLVKYSWWTYRFNARKKNVGWRIDYFFVTQNIIDKGWVKETFIDNDVFGSDHCPVGVVLEF